jgi:hypothetical protein
MDNCRKSNYIENVNTKTKICDKTLTYEACNKNGLKGHILEKVQINRNKLIKEN